MRTATAAEGNVARSAYARPARPTSQFPVEEIDAALGVRRDALVGATAEEPLVRIAALLVSISRNNSYEGRDPKTMPDTLTSGFVADLLGLDIGSLASLLVDMRRRGLIDSDPSGILRLKDLSGLEALADA
jgi:CRP/FNR family transcriptional regulator